MPVLIFVGIDIRTAIPSVMAMFILPQLLVFLDFRRRGSLDAKASGAKNRGFYGFSFGFSHV